MRLMGKGKGIFLVLLFILLLSGCSTLEWPFSSLTNTPEQGLSPAFTPTLTETATVANCAYVWSSRSLPDITLQLNQAFRTSGMNTVEAEASAYGEDCFDTETNQVVRFLAMQTDFSIRVEVERMGDPQELGKLIENIMRVLESFPPGKVPGPNPGYVGVTFAAGSETSNLWFRRSEADKLLQEGLRGSALYDALQQP